MDYYFECFNKMIHLTLYRKASNIFLFWMKRFCPNVKIIKKQNNLINKIVFNYNIEFINSKKYNYIFNKNNIKIYGELSSNEGYIAKFVTQCFQNLLIEDDILIIPAACVSNYEKAILILGDFWQGKTAVAINMNIKYKLNIISDNYVAIKDGFVIGSTNYLSIRKENIKTNSKSILSINDRFFYKNFKKRKKIVKITGFLLPHINSSDKNIHIISKEESIWYLYQKFTRLLSGETILFEGKLPSPIFLNKRNSKIILKIIYNLLIKNEIKYTSTSIDNIVEEGYEILNKEKAKNE